MKKLGCLLIILVIISCFSTSVMAADNMIVAANETSNVEIINQETTYQDILDKLNDEYGTSVHFEKETRSGGASSVSIDMTPVEFEEHIRSAIEMNMRANAEADEKIKSLKTEYKEDTTCFVFEKKSSANGDKYSAVFEDDFNTKAAGRANVVYAYQDLKQVEGAMISLGAYVNLDRGYWAFSGVFALDVLHMTALNGTLWFHPNTGSYSFIDARRTCATEFNGVVRDETTGIIIDTNARRYAEFWAGKDMPDPEELM